MYSCIQCVKSVVFIILFLYLLKTLLVVLPWIPTLYPVNNLFMYNLNNNNTKLLSFLVLLNGDHDFGLYIMKENIFFESFFFDQQLKIFLMLINHNTVFLIL